jgi:hypothetical protein
MKQGLCKNCINSEGQSNIFFIISQIVLYLLFYITSALAQPSGGPYGPIQQKYELPEVTGKIFYVAPNGNTKASGESVDKPTTLEKAITLVKTGDAIILRGGIYRTGNLVLNQSITLQPYADEQPVLKGTYVANEWKELGNGLWSTKWSRLFPSKPQNWWVREHQGKYTPPYRFNNDMVFMDGKFLQAAGWEGEVNDDTYFIDYETGLVYVGVDPSNHLIEITAFDVAILRTTGKVHGRKSDKSGLTIRGITFTQYAYRALEIEGKDPEGRSLEKDHGKDVVGTTLEHCTISYCSRVAGYLRGDSLTVSNCRISDTSTEGLYIIASNDVLLEKNIILRNNIEHITGYFPAAVKIFNQCYRVTCRDNLVLEHPYSNGIWYDVGNVDGVFVNNWIQDVGNRETKFSKDRPWPSDNGFFFEISKGVICAANVFVNCDHGVWVLNSSDAQIYNNTFINSTACFARDNRGANPDHFGWHPSTGPDVDERDGHIFVNNLMYGDENYNRPLLFVWQPANHCKSVNNQQLKQIDHNVYVHDSIKKGIPLILWSPADNEKCQEEFASPNNLQKTYMGFATHSRYFADYHGPLFKSSELGNYQLLKNFPGINSATELPDDLRNLISQSEQYVGAFPPVQ